MGSSQWIDIIGGIDMGENQKFKIKEWKIKDYSALFGIEDNRTLAKKLKRTELAVTVKRGQAFPLFTEWAKKKGYSAYQREHIKEFLKERGQLKQKSTK